MTARISCRKSRALIFLGASQVVFRVYHVTPDLSVLLMVGVGTLVAYLISRGFS